MRSDITMDIHRQRGPARANQLVIAGSVFKPPAKRIRYLEQEDALTEGQSIERHASMWANS
jgi:hypothetical protein